jgi:hypothetical protein
MHIVCLCFFTFILLIWCYQDECSFPIHFFLWLFFVSFLWMQRLVMGGNCKKYSINIIFIFTLKDWYFRYFIFINTMGVILKVIMVKSMIMNIVDFICFAWKFIQRKIFNFFGSLLIVNLKIINYVFWISKFLSIVNVSKVSLWSSFLLTFLISCSFTYGDKIYQGMWNSNQLNDLANLINN